MQLFHGRQVVVYYCSVGVVVVAVFLALFLVVAWAIEEKVFICRIVMVGIDCSER